CLKEEDRQPGHPLAEMSNVAFDAANEVARLAAEHFLERRLRNFAYIGWDGIGWSERRGNAFRRQLELAGHTLFVYHQGSRPADRGWERDQSLLAEWIKSLPKPIGILACNDERGRMVVDCCRAAGVDVPEQAAVLGVDNDELFC